MRVTKRQQEIYEFICEYLDSHGYSPSLEEIRDRFDLSAVSTVHEHVQHLIELELLTKEPGRARVLRPVVNQRKNAGEKEIPVLGTVAAGEPIEAIEIPENIALSSVFAGSAQTYALRVKGESMKEDGILDGDIIIVHRRDTAENGEVVIALVENDEVTVKRLYREGNRVRLQPANPAVPPIILDDHKSLKIQGVVIGLLRKF